MKNRGFRDFIERRRGGPFRETATSSPRPSPPSDRGEGAMSQVIRRQCTEAPCRQPDQLCARQSSDQVAIMPWPMHGCDKQTFNHDQPMTTHRFSRRTFLRGVGVTMALPWMESLTVWGDTPPAGVKPASEAPVRLAVLFSGNGF